MTEKLTLGSLFSGSGAFELAGIFSGIEPVWASEIAPFAIRVTTKRLPCVKHLGDISRIDGSKIEPVDVITFGSPCTNLSIAGKREGLTGKQSSLFYEAIRVIKEMRHATENRCPRWICWENVPGAFSSNHGADFGAVLTEICRVTDPESPAVPAVGPWPHAGTLLGDRWSVAYRTVDAQHFGVPQRRRRIYLVADFGSECAADILFESEGVCRDFAAGLFAGEAATGGFAPGAGGTGCIGFEPGAISRLPAPFFYHEMTGTLRASFGDNRPAVVYGISSYDSEAMKSANPHAGIYKAETARTLDAQGGNPGCNQGGIAICEPTFGLEGNGQRPSHRGSGVSEGIAPTLNTIEQHGAAYAMTCGSFTSIGEECAPTLQARDYKDPPLVNQQYIVRRLTPQECASLQGFPRWWCAGLEDDAPDEDDIAFWTEVWETHRRVTNPGGKPKNRKQVLKWLRNPHSDSAEYSLWGNGCALPCCIFVLRGIVDIAQDAAG